MAKKPNMYLLQCRQHLKRPWYAVCIHLFSHKGVIGVLTKPGRRKVGLLLCTKCAAQEKPPTVENLRGCCDLCVDEFIIPAAKAYADAQKTPQPPSN